MDAGAGEDVGADEIVKRPQQRGAGPDVIGQRRQAERNALARIALRLPVEMR
jgi:hypothetical protein